jgi:hypothetical protein
MTSQRMHKAEPGQVPAPVVQKGFGVRFSCLDIKIKPRQRTHRGQSSVDPGGGAGQNIDPSRFAPATTRQSKRMASAAAAPPTE